MAKNDNKSSLKDKLKGAVESAKTAVKDVDLSGVKEKIKETNESAKEAVKKIKIPDVNTSKIKGVFKKADKHILVQLNDSTISFYLPDGYKKQKQTKGSADTEAEYQKSVSTSENVVKIFKTTSEKAMDPDDVQGIIDNLHNNMSDSQGIIEVKNGETKRGFKYVYSIVKSLSSEQFGGVRYFLRLNLFDNSDVIGVQASFTEKNMTGQRESMCMELARRADLVTFSETGLEGWAQDPYDPNYTKGYPKNLAEKEGLDGLFPENPLTLARELLIAVLRDEYVTTREDSNAEETTSAEQKGSETDLTPEEKASREKESLSDLFVDECRRYTKPIESDGNDKALSETPTKGNTSTTTDTDEDVLTITAISTRNAIKVIYYLMAVDGEIFHSEEEKFDSIGKELDPQFAEHKEQIIKECQSQLDKVIDPEDFYDTLQDGVEYALMHSKATADTFITPKLLVWDLLTVAYSDESYDEAERRLLKYIVRKTGIDKAVFLEMESSILTMMDIEKELAWIKTTNKPYLTIEAMVNELADRKNVIFESIKDLISL